MTRILPLLVPVLACTPPDPADRDRDPGHPPAGHDPGDDDDDTSPVPCDAEVLDVDVAAAPTGSEHDRLVTVTLSAEAGAALLCIAADEPDDRFLLESPDAATTHAFRLQGLRAGAAYRCVAGPPCAAGPGAAREVGFATGDGRFTPGVETSVAPGAEPPRGWLLTTVLTEGCGGPGSHVLFDPAGRVRWEAPLEFAYMDSELLHVGDAVLLYGGASPEDGPQAVHLWDGLVWQAALPGDHEFHHDAKQLADGRVLTLEARTVSRDGQSWRGFGARAFDPATMAVSFDYTSQSAVDEGVLGPGEDNDAWHANWVDLLDHGQGPVLYVSLCYMSQVLAIDAETHRVAWVFGPGGDFALFDASGAPLGDDQFTQCQHGLDVSADGRRLLAYDNGRERDSSRVVEYAIDPAAGRATLTWEWTDGWKENILGDADWLPDGDVLVTQGHPGCWSSPGDRSEFVKVDPIAGERWRLALLDPDHAVYRGQLLDGCEVLSNVGQCPALEPRWAELAAVIGAP